MKPQQQQARPDRHIGSIGGSGHCLLAPHQPASQPRPTPVGPQTVTSFGTHHYQKERHPLDIRNDHFDECEQQERIDSRPANEVAERAVRLFGLTSWAVRAVRSAAQRTAPTPPRPAPRSHSTVTSAHGMSFPPGGGEAAPFHFKKTEWKM